MGARYFLGSGILLTEQQQDAMYALDQSLPKGKGAKFEYKSSTDSNDNSYKFEDEVLLSSVKLRKLRHLFVNRSQVRIVKH